MEETRSDYQPQQVIEDLGTPFPSPQAANEQKENEKAAKVAKERADKALKDRVAQDKAAKEAREKAERELKAKEDKAMREQAERQNQERLRREKAEADAREKAARAERLGELGKPGAYLQVQLENGWVDSSDEEFKQVCDHVAGGETRFSIQARGMLYIVDWSDKHDPKQINARTNKARSMRVQFR
jgi:flagellar biosynthesis GTPase FlhF